MDGKRGKPNRRVRLEEIAKRCGVSVSTASRALTGAAGVRDPVRAAIIEAARNLSYAIPTSIVGRKVIVAASGAAMLDNSRAQFTFHVLDGLNERARVLGVELATCPVSGSDDELALLREAEADPSVAGCLFLTLEDDMLPLMQGFSKPIVLINGDDPTMRHSSVTPCNRAPAQFASHHLIGLGHRRILFLLRRGRRTIQRRYEGWRDALILAGISDVDQLVVEVDDWLPEPAAQAIAARIDKSGLDFTAVLTAGDSLAYGAIMGLQRRGIAVPGEVSVIGMDDLPQSAFSSPPLTAMHIPMREMGSEALSLLLDQLSGGPMLPRRVELACRLVERQSTAHAPAPHHERIPTPSGVAGVDAGTRP